MVVMKESERAEEGQPALVPLKESNYHITKKGAPLNLTIKNFCLE